MTINQLCRNVQDDAVVNIIVVNATCVDISVITRLVTIEFCILMEDKVKLCDMAQNSRWL